MATIITANACCSAPGASSLRPQHHKKSLATSLANEKWWSKVAENPLKWGPEIHPKPIKCKLINPVIITGHGCSLKPEKLAFITNNDVITNALVAKSFFTPNLEQ